MAILKNRLKDNYTMIPNEIITSKISNNSFRLLVYLWSKPSHWDVNQKNIAKDFAVHTNTITNWISELKKNGLIEIQKVSNGKSFNYVYVLSTEAQYIVDRNISDTQLSDTQSPIHNLTTSSEIGVHNKTNNNKTEYSNTDNSNTKTIDTYFSSGELNVLFEEFLAMRKELKAKNTDRAIKLLVSELNKFDDVAKKKMIEQSIMNSWKSVYPLKNNKNKPTHEEKMSWLTK